MTSVQPSGRFGALNIAEDGTITSFKEKPKGDGAWINGGFFVCEPEVFNYIEEGNENEIFERRPLETIANHGGLVAYKPTKQAPWKVWDKQNAYVSLAGVV